MTTIDQRILIPASPDVVWAYISSIERNREWRVDHQDLAFITTFRKGQGTRWRYTNGSRQEYVAEITAWYERMGYEYHIVDDLLPKGNPPSPVPENRPDRATFHGIFARSLYFNLL